MSEGNDGYQGQELPEGMIKLLLIGGKMNAEPENLDKPKKLLTQYEKNQIEFQQTTQALDVLVSTWKYVVDADLLDEVDNLLVRQTFVEKMVDLVKRL